MPFLKIGFRSLSRIEIGWLRRGILVVGAGTLGLGLLPWFSPAGISIAAYLLLVGAVSYAFAAPPEIRTQAIPLPMFLAPLFMIACLWVQTGDAMETALRVLVGWLVAFSIILELSEPHRMLRFLRAIVLGGVVLLVVLEYYSIFVFHSPFLSADISHPTRSGRNSIGFFLAVAIPSVLAFRSTTLRALILLYFVFSAVYLQSRGVLVAVSAATVVTLTIRGGVTMAHGWTGILARRFRPVAFLAILSLVALAASQYQLLLSLLDQYVFVQHTSDDLRVRLAELAMATFRSHMLVGIGVGQFQYISPEGYLTHNDYLSVLAELGLLGFLPFFGLIAGTVWRAVRLLLHWLAQTDGPGARASLARGMIGLSVASYLFVINAYTALMFWVAIGVVSTAMPGTMKSPEVLDQNHP